MRQKREPEDSDTGNWGFSQCFGDKSDIDSISESDVISAVEFDHTGDFLATGDRGGRVVLFQRQQGTPEYRFLTEFQSHDREFDYLKSLEIEEKINQIKWCRRQNNALFLLSANDKTIKLWKVFSKNIKVVAENNATDRIPAKAFEGMDISKLRLPRSTLHDQIVATTPRRMFSNGHTYHINSISVNSDNETFLSSDDLRINLWNLEVPGQSFNIVDTRPASMEELTEVITATECHPTSCNLFMYSTCKGNVRLADMRERALCDQYAKIYEDVWDPMQDSFFTEITSSISDIKFSGSDGRYIVARDFMSVKIWDVNMDRQPLKTIRVHDNIRNMLCATYETDSIFDKFEVVCSGDAKSVMTGSYSNNFLIYPNALVPDADEQVISLSADKNAFRKRAGGVGGDRQRGVGMMRRPRRQVDFRKNILNLSWHPYENTVAIAATNNLFVFSATP